MRWRAGLGRDTEEQGEEQKTMPLYLQKLTSVVAVGLLERNRGLLALGLQVVLQVVLQVSLSAAREWPGLERLELKTWH